MADKRQQAQRLYVRNGVLQQDIAALVGVSEKTISQWKQADRWDRQKAAVITTKEEELRRMYAMLSAQNAAIEARGEGYNFPSAKEADAINKLATAIKRLENEAGLATTVDVFMGFNEWLRKTEPEAAKQFMHLSDLYVKSLLA